MRIYLIPTKNRLFDDQPASEVSNKYFIEEAECSGLSFDENGFEEWYNASLTTDKYYLRIINDHHDN